MLAPLLDRFAHTLFIVDEAYAEFSRQSCRSLLETYSNLIITRTFSKAYGLAGCRVGYLMSHPSIVRNIQRVFNPKSVNAFAQVSAIAALQDQEYLNEYVDQVHRGQKQCIEHFKNLDLEVHSTPANFFLLKTHDPTRVLNALVQEGVYVRNRSHLPGLEGYLRISVGTEEQSEEMLMRFDHAWQRIQNQI
jgi:histidinol-phosphate aminotransferase